MPRIQNRTLKKEKTTQRKRLIKYVNVSSNYGPFLMNFKAMKGAHKAKEDMKKELDK